MESVIYAESFLDTAKKTIEYLESNPEWHNPSHLRWSNNATDYTVAVVAFKALENMLLGVREAVEETVIVHDELTICDHEWLET